MRTLKDVGLSRRRSAEKLLDSLVLSWGSENATRLMHNDMNVQRACVILDLSPDMVSATGGVASTAHAGSKGPKILRDAYRKKAIQHGRMDALGPLSIIPKDLESAFERLASYSHRRRSECHHWFGGLDPVRMDLILHVQVMLLLGHRCGNSNTSAPNNDRDEGIPLEYKNYDKLLSFLQCPEGNLAKARNYSGSKASDLPESSKECWNFIELASQVLRLTLESSSASTSVNPNVKRLFVDRDSASSESPGMRTVLSLMIRCLAQEANSQKALRNTGVGEEPSDSSTAGTISINATAAHLAHILVNIIESTGTTWLATDNRDESKADGGAKTTCALDQLCSTIVGQSVVAFTPLLLGMFGQIRPHRDTKSFLSSFDMQANSPRFMVVLPLMRALVVLVRKIPDLLVRAGIIWQVLQLAFMPLVARARSQGTEDEPRAPVPFHPVALLAAECLSTLSTHKSNPENSSALGILEHLLTSGVVSLLRRLSPGRALSVLSSKILAPMVYWEPASMGAEILEYVCARSQAFEEKALSELPSAGSIISFSEEGHAMVEANDFALSGLETERQVGGVYLRIYNEMRGTVDPMIDADFEPLGFCQALFEELKSLALTKTAAAPTDAGIHTYFPIKLEGDLSMCEEPLHCLLTLFLHVKRPDTVANRIHKNGDLSTLFAILSRVMYPGGPKTTSVSPTVIQRTLCVTEILLNFPQCAVAAAQPLSQAGDSSPSMIDVLTQMLALCRPTYLMSLATTKVSGSESGSHDAAVTEKLQPPIWTGALLRAIHSLCAQGSILDPLVTDVILLPKKGLLVSLCDIISYDDAHVQDGRDPSARTSGKIALLTHRRSSSWSSSSSFVSISSAAPPIWSEVARATVICLSSLLRHKQCGGRVQAVLRLWLPAELHRLARDASISDMHCNDFLYTLVLTRADITAEIESF
jgi:hypothetical protein